MNLLDKLSLYIKNHNCFKKNIIAALFGSLLTCAMPPVDLWPLAIISLSGFLVIINSSECLKNAFKTGWWFGFGHFVTGLYWIAFALLVDVANFGWLIPFALFGIPAVIAVYTGVVAIITWYVSRYIYGWRLVIVFACVWTLIEMLRGWLFTGFPWNLAASIWSGSENMLQFASIGGAYSLTLVTVLGLAMPATIIQECKRWFKKKNELMPFTLAIINKKLLPLFLSLLMLLAIFIWGGMRLKNNPIDFVTGIKLRIVQANIPQTMKWEDEWRNATVNRYLEMSHSNGFENITHIIWPETALPFAISDDSPLLEVIANITPKGGAVITGALRAEYSEKGFLQNMWNSLIVVSDDGKLYSHYDKSHLVPFGEYVPLRNFLPLEKITHGSVDFASGKGSTTITAPAFPPFGGLVCYEIIFPGKVIEEKNPPKAIINVTNDAWYGNTAGPYQHFEMARMRAVEEGLPVIRAANNGISGVIDSYGRVVDKTKLMTTAVLDTKLPNKTGITIYARYRSAVLLLMISCFILIACKNCRITND